MKITALFYIFHSFFRFQRTNQSKKKCYYLHTLLDMGAQTRCNTMCLTKITLTNAFGKQKQSCKGLQKWQAPVSNSSWFLIRAANQSTSQGIQWKHFISNVMLKSKFKIKTVCLKRRSRQYQSVQRRQHRKKNKRVLQWRRKKQRRMRSKRKQRRKRSKLKPRRKNQSKRIRKLQPQQQEERFKKLQQSRKILKNGTRLYYNCAFSNWETRKGRELDLFHFPIRNRRPRH